MMKKMKGLVIGIVACFAALVVTEAAQACHGSLARGVGRVLGVQRRQERRAAGYGVFGGRRAGNCSGGICSP